jgi:hypothetical protein
MQFSATLLLLLGNAILGHAAPAVAEQAAGSNLRSARIVDAIQRATPVLSQPNAVAGTA